MKIGKMRIWNYAPASIIYLLRAPVISHTYDGNISHK
jgi:hypothetical protein